MPNRILREGILTSERVSALSWQAEVFYRRLMSVVDDYGRYYAKPMALRAACFPMQLDRAKDSDIEKWLAESVEQKLIMLYDAGGTTFLELAAFRQQVRAKKSKYPDPVNGAAHPIVERTADAIPTQRKEKKPDESFAKFWEVYPRKVAKGAAEKSWSKISPDDVLSQTILEAVQAQLNSEAWTKDGGEFIPHPATWLNQRRWEDEVQGVAEAVNARCRYCAQPAIRFTNDVPHCGVWQHVEWAKQGAR